MCYLVVFLNSKILLHNYANNSLLQAGANMIVSGSAVIGAANQASTIKLLRDTVQQAIEKR